MKPLCACLAIRGRLCSTSEVACSALCMPHVSTVEKDVCATVLGNSAAYLAASGQVYVCMVLYLCSESISVCSACALILLSLKMGQSVCRFAFTCLALQRWTPWPDEWCCACSVGAVHSEHAAAAGQQDGPSASASGRGAHSCSQAWEQHAGVCCSADRSALQQPPSWLFSAHISTCSGLRCGQQVPQLPGWFPSHASEQLPQMTFLQCC